MNHNTHRIPRLSTADAYVERQALHNNSNTHKKVNKFVSPRSNVSISSPRRLLSTPASSVYQLSTSNTRFVVPHIDTCMDVDNRSWTFSPGKKPKLLQHLELILSNALVDQGVEQPRPSCRRLNVFSMVFDLFIKEFSSFRALLQRIKGEYDGLIEACVSKLRYIDPMRARLSTIKDEVDTHLQQKSKAHEKKIEEIKQYCAETLTAKTEAMSKSDKLNAELTHMSELVSSLKIQLAQTKASNQTLFGSIRFHEAKAQQAIQDKIAAEKQSIKASKKLKLVQESFDQVTKDLNVANNRVQWLESAETREKNNPDSNDVQHCLRMQIKTLMKKHQDLLDLYENATENRSRNDKKFLSSIQESAASSSQLIDDIE